MIEEPADSHMYENETCQVLRTLEKKQNKIDEINRLLSEEITPALAKRTFQLHVRYIEIEDDSHLVSKTEFSWKDESRCGSACLFVFDFCTWCELPGAHLPIACSCVLRQCATNPFFGRFR